MRWLAAVPLILLLSAACGSDGGDDTPTPEPTREPSVAPTQSVQRTPAFDIRETDLESLPEVQAALEDTGGAYVQTDVIYTDVTDDGFDEAVVPISSEGTAGYLGFLVYIVNGDQVELLLQEYPSLGGAQVEKRGDKLVMIEAAPGPDDPECCPSFLQITTYAWNGAAFAVESVVTEPNPDVVPVTAVP